VVYRPVDDAPEDAAPSASHPSYRGGCNPASVTVTSRRTAALASNHAIYQAKRSLDKPFHISTPTGAAPRSRPPMVIPTVSRADLAEFMLGQLNGDPYLRGTPAIMY